MTASDPILSPAGPDAPARRGVLASAVGAAGAAALAGWTAQAGHLAGAGRRGAGASGVTSAATDRVPAPRATRPFRGPRQPGIVDHPQTYAAFVALDLVAPLDAGVVRRLLTVLTDDIERLMGGRGTLTDQEPELAAVPAALTVTVAVGPAVVAATGAEVPSWLAPLPAFAIDALQERWCGGDLLLQICAESPTTVAHAQRRLITTIEPMSHVRWVQRGFREPYEGPGVPMRNLMGQVDGTVQPDTAGPDDGLLFVGAPGGLDGAPAWLRDGSALVLRRIRMTLDTWDRVDRLSRENAIGRRLDTGAPVTAPPGAPAGTKGDLDAKDSLGFHVIDDGAHMRRAHAQAPHERFLRRPYSYDDAPATGERSDSGLIFAAYMADPVRQFVPVQQRLAEKDLLNIWTTPIGSAVFAVLPGARHGEILGQSMLP